MPPEIFFKKVVFVFQTIRTATLLILKLQGAAATLQAHGVRLSQPRHRILQSNTEPGKKGIQSGLHRYIGLRAVEDYTTITYTERN